MPPSIFYSTPSSHSHTDPHFYIGLLDEGSGKAYPVQELTNVSDGLPAKQLISRAFGGLFGRAERIDRSDRNGCGHCNREAIQPHPDRVPRCGPLQCPHNRYENEQPLADLKQTLANHCGDPLRLAPKNTARSCIT